MNNKKTTTSIITTVTFATLILSISVTPAFADQPPSFATWANNDEDICYRSDELNSLDAGGFQNSANIINQFEKSRLRYNTINGLDIIKISTCGAQHDNDVGSADLSLFGPLAQMNGVYPSGVFQSAYVEFNTQKAFGINSNTCNTWNWDIEWVMNHEMGHYVGLDHHNPVFTTPHSVVYPNCNAVWEVLQTDDINKLNNMY